MKKSTFTFKDGQNEEIFVYKWEPDDKIVAAIQLAHGMAETAARYERFAKALTDSGFIVYINDHRGHGNTAKKLENLGYLGEGDGFKLMIEDMYILTNIIKKENPNLPVFLFGHSMGSFLCQRYITLYSKELNGVILSGTNCNPGFIVNLGIIIAKREMKNKGRRFRSHKLNKLSFGNFNNTFKPNRTEFDWLSSDEKEVDKYINDPYCGEIFTTSFFYDFLNGVKNNYNKSALENISKDLPIYIFAGDKDPVGKNGKGIIKLYNMYKILNIVDVEYKLYKNGRHEMLNEKNKEEVTNDILQWLKKHLK